MNLTKFKTAAECAARVEWLDEQLAVCRRADDTPNNSDLIKKLEREKKSIFKRRNEILSPALL